MLYPAIDKITLGYWSRNSNNQHRGTENNRKWPPFAPVKIILSQQLPSPVEASHNTIDNSYLFRKFSELIHAQDLSHHSHYIIASSSALWSLGSLGSRACVPNLFTWPATYLIFTEINTYLSVDLFHLNNMVGHGMELCHMWHWRDNNLCFTIPGVRLKNIRHQGSHFFNSKGACSTLTS